MASAHIFADEVHDTRTADTRLTAAEVLAGPGFTVMAIGGAVAGAVAGAALGAEIGSAFPAPCGMLGTMLGSGLAAGGWCLLASAVRTVRGGFGGRPGRHAESA